MDRRRNEKCLMSNFALPNDLIGAGAAYSVVDNLSCLIGLPASAKQS